MNASVLGATGFIGSNVCATLLERGWKVSALIRPGARDTALEGLDVIRHPGDLDDEDSMVRAMRRGDVVFHAAAFNPAHALRPGRDPRAATAQIDRVIRSCRRAGIARLVYTSASCALPGQPAGGVSSVVAVKRAMERALIDAAGPELPVSIVTPTHCIGERDVKPTGGGLIIAMTRHEVPAIVDGCFNAVDIRDVARVHVDAAVSAEPMLRRVAAGPDTTVLAFATMLAGVLGVPPPRRIVPAWVAYPAALVSELVSVARRRPAVLRVEMIDLIRLARPLDGLAGASDLPGAVRRAVEWFQRHGYLP